jgi:uncharacterized protein YodC (DUF2158 family)
MEALSKSASMAIAALLLLNVPLVVPAYSEPASVHQDRPIQSGDLVRVRSGGPLMTVTGVQGDQVNCSWADWNGRLQSESFPVASLAPPLTVPPEDPNLKQDERVVDQYYRTHCPRGSISITTGKFECAY